MTTTTRATSRRFIEDFALIGDLHTAALVGRDAAIEWYCTPDYDSDACFASLLGDSGNGCWSIAPDEPVLASSRKYRDGTLVLETTLQTSGGSVRIVDFMPRREQRPMLIRIVEGASGSVAMHTDLTCRYGFGRIVPLTRASHGGVTMLSGPDAMILRSSVPLDVRAPDISAAFTVSAGESATFALGWYPSHETPSDSGDVFDALRTTTRWWTEWSGRCTYDGPYREAVVRSLITLKALTYEPTGAAIAAPTTSLPEKLGGKKNWDYRFSWIRDSSFTVLALLAGGYQSEARAWRDWLLRMLGGDPAKLQIMYTARGGRRTPERELEWLDGYENAKPVRCGNAAYEQFQLGIYGEVMRAVHVAHAGGIEIDETAWSMIVDLLAFLERSWKKPGSGIWESRSEPARYTLSAMMSWKAFDCAVELSRSSANFPGPVERWETLRQEIHDDACAAGFNPEAGAFTQTYGSTTLDASLLLASIIAFLPADDARVVKTVAAIEERLRAGAFVLRNDPSKARNEDSEPEGAFLACNFWLVEQYAKSGRTDDARELFERLLAVRNDVGLLSEEYDTERNRLVGNFPQTFSHSALVNAAMAIAQSPVPSR